MKCYSIGDLQKQITELKSQVQKLEQDNARQEGQVICFDLTLKKYTLFFFISSRVATGSGSDLGQNVSN